MTSNSTFDSPALPVASMRAMRPALVFALITLFGFGFVYALAGTAANRLLFADQATGSLVLRDGRVVGSARVSQPFASERYFHGRPSASGHDPTAAAGSNLARSNPDLHARIAETSAEVARRERIPRERVPADLLTQSGSGLDPDISPDVAAVQVARVARARGMTEARVRGIVAQHTEARQWGVLGAPRVNVLALNLALDAAERDGLRAQ